MTLIRILILMMKENLNKKNLKIVLFKKKIKAMRWQKYRQAQFILEKARILKKKNWTNNCNL